MGAFLMSGILHVVGSWGLGRGADPIKITGFFLMNGLGIILESLYKLSTGKRVGGIVGLIWTYIWLILWGNFLVDAWFERGLGTSRHWPLHVSPAFHVFNILFP
jgi:hypothetical protein